MSRSVVVTGANSGIGLATTLLLAHSGYDVIGTVRSAAKADSVVNAAERQRLAVRTVLCDVTDASATAAAFGKISKLTGGGPWAVVNNAGYAQAGAIEDVDDAHVRRQLETNLVAPARVAQLVLPGMRERGDGRIVNISSVAGRLSVPVMGWYCASKHGLEAMTDALRMEVAPFGVRVSLVEPGSFGTAIWADADYPSDPATPEYGAAYARGSGGTRAMSRFMPDPVWVARTVLLSLRSPVPLARYLVGVDAVGGTVAERLVPTFVSDKVKAVAAGLIRLPFRR